MRSIEKSIKSGAFAPPTEADRALQCPSQNQKYSRTSWLSVKTRMTLQKVLGYTTAGGVLALGLSQLKGAKAQPYDPYEPFSSWQSLEAAEWEIIMRVEDDMRTLQSGYCTMTCMVPQSTIEAIKLGVGIGGGAAGIGVGVMTGWTLPITIATLPMAANVLQWKIQSAFDTVKIACINAGCPTS